MTYDYFYGQQAEQFSFYRIPKALFTDEAFSSISTDIKFIGLFQSPVSTGPIRVDFLHKPW